MAYFGQVVRTTTRSGSSQSPNLKISTDITSDHPLFLRPSSRVTGLSHQSRPTFRECRGFEPTVLLHPQFGALPMSYHIPNELLCAICQRLLGNSGEFFVVVVDNLSETSRGMLEKLFFFVALRPFHHQFSLLLLNKVSAWMGTIILKNFCIDGHH